MKQNILLFILLLISNFSGFAQSHNMAVGARGGLSIPKIKAFGDNPMSNGYSSRLLGGGGIFFEYQFNNLFSLRPGVEFSAQGGTRDGMQAIPKRMISKLPVPEAFKNVLPDYIYANFDSKTTFNYLTIPILAQFGWKLEKASPFRIYANAGPFVAFLMSAKQVTTGNSQMYIKAQDNNYISIDEILKQLNIPIEVGERPFNTDESIKEQTNSFNWGLGGNAGISYQIGRHRIFFEGGGNYGFKVLQKDDANGENRIGVGTVMFGYAFSF